MKLRALVTVSVFTAVLPAFAAPTCVGAQVLKGNDCTLSVALGWGAAGGGMQSVLTFFVPPTASGPVDLEVTNISSNLGSTYTGYFGFVGHPMGQSDPLQMTLADVVAGGHYSLGLFHPGKLIQFVVTNICWDPSCTGPAPASAVPNMFSMEFLISSPNPNDINTNDIGLTVQFLNGNQVTFETTETALRTNSLYSLVPGISLGATPDVRYVMNGTGFAQPIEAISISNLDNPNPITGTVTLQDLNGNIVATAPVPLIPAGGAAGYLVVGRMPGDPLGLFPSDTVLPAGPDGIFHGSLIVSMKGQIPTGILIVLDQEYNGNAMINMPVFHSNVL